MLTDEELPPAPPFKVTHWLFTGMVAWSLFFGVVGGLAVLLLIDFGPEKINPTRELREDVQTVNGRVDQLEQRTQQLNEQQTKTQQANAAPSAADTQLTRILIGITQLKTAYENETPLTDGIQTLKQSIKDSHIQQSLDNLQKLASNNFPSKEKILDDLQSLQTPQNLRNENGAQPLTDWRSRAKTAFSQLVRVTPTKNIVNDKDISRVEQAVAAGDFGLAQKFAAQLPETPSTDTIKAEIATRFDAENTVQKIVTQISQAVSGSQGSLY
jgi:outer membrane murein-binding lipoprotein Lpp